MSTYTVKQGEGIGDVVLNSTGSMLNWDSILDANGFDTWTPQLVAGQTLTIPDTVVTIDPNTKRQLTSYPACNASVSDVYGKIISIFDIMDNNWILETGFWNDNAVWIDTKTWND